MIPKMCPEGVVFFVHARLIWPVTNESILSAFSGSGREKRVFNWNPIFFFRRRPSRYVNFGLIRGEIRRQRLTSTPFLVVRWQCSFFRGGYRRIGMALDNRRIIMAKESTYVSAIVCSAVVYIFWESSISLIENAVDNKNGTKRIKDISRRITY